MRASYWQVEERELSLAETSAGLDEASVEALRSARRALMKARQALSRRDVAEVERWLDVAEGCLDAMASRS